eukprot:4939565-Amphidinium_carterae.1
MVVLDADMAGNRLGLLARFVLPIPKGPCTTSIRNARAVSKPIAHCGTKLRTVRGNNHASLLGTRRLRRSKRAKICKPSRYAYSKVSSMKLHTVTT